MVKSLLVATLVAFTIACNKSSDGAGNRKVNTEPTGFKATGPATPDAPERYTIGCEVAGQPNSNYEIDSRLNIGHEFSLETKNFENGVFQSGAGVQKITGKTANSITSNYRITSNVGLPIPSNNFNEVCVKTGPDANGNYDWNCNFAAMFNSPRGLTEEGCTVNVQAPEDGQESVVPGTYMGRKAYWQVTKYSGEITCNGANLGRGSLSWNAVYSNEVPAPGISYCGGTNLFIGSVMQLDSGKVLSEGMMSITKAPLVSE